MPEGDIVDFSLTNFTRYHSYHKISWGSFFFYVVSHWPDYSYRDWHVSTVFVSYDGGGAEDHHGEEEIEEKKEEVADTDDGDDVDTDVENDGDDDDGGGESRVDGSDKGGDGGGGYGGYYENGYFWVCLLRCLVLIFFISAECTDIFYVS